MKVGRKKVGVPAALDGKGKDEEKDGQNQPVKEELFKLPSESAVIGVVILPWRERGHFPLYLATTSANWKIGRYIATSRPPIVTPRKRISIGSSIDVKAPTAESTSSS